MIGMLTSMFGLTGLGVSIVVAILLCIHVVRTGREMFWLWIILLFQPLGGLVYFIAIVLPEWMGGSRARKVSQFAREALDPTRAYREAKAAVEDTPTVGNQMRLAAAAADLGRWDEAEHLYAAGAHGIHADDSALLIGRARALLELNRPAEALPLIERVAEQEDKGRSPQTAVLLARAYEGLGRLGEADAAYQWASERLPGLEGLARYGAFMARSGRRAEAEAVLADIDRRMEKATGRFRAEARAWRDLVAAAL